MSSFSAGSVIARMRADTSDFRRGLIAMKAQMASLNGTVAAAGSGFRRFGAAVKSHLASAATASQQFARTLGRSTFVAGAALLGLGGYGIKIAGDFETTRSALVGLFGSAEAADATMKRIKREAAATPFELTGLSQGVKQLASVVDTGDEAIDILMNVGKAITASGGGQVEMDRVVFNLKQIKGIGKLEMIDLKELRRAIPIFDKLVEASGTTIEAIRDAKDPSAELFKVFEKGGKKLKAVDQAFTLQGGNLNQLISNLKDTAAIFFSDFVIDIGLFDKVKRGLSNLITYLNDNKEAIVDFFKRGINFVRDKMPIILGAITGGLIPALGALAIALMTNPLNLWIAAGAALGWWVNELAQRMGGWTPFIEKVSEKFNDLWPTIRNVATAIGEHLWPKIQNLWQKFKDDMIPVIIEWHKRLMPLNKLIGVVIVGALGLFIDAMAFLADKFNIIMPILVAFGALLVGAKVYGAIMTVKAAIVGASGLKAALGGLAAFVKSPAMLNPWTALAAAAIAAFVAIQNKANETKRVLKDTEDNIIRAQDSMRDTLIGARERVNNGTMSEETYQSILKNSQLPAFDTGGIVPGRRGSPQVILAHGGETVLPTHKASSTQPNQMGGMGGTVVNLHLGGIVATSKEQMRVVGREIIDSMNEAQAAAGRPLINGGSVS